MQKDDQLPHALESLFTDMGKDPQYTKTALELKPQFVELRKAYHNVSERYKLTLAIMLILYEALASRKEFEPQLSIVDVVKDMAYFYTRVMEPACRDMCSVYADELGLKNKAEMKDILKLVTFNRGDTLQ
jgi:hypothetical protein